MLSGKHGDVRPSPLFMCVRIGSGRNPESPLLHLRCVVVYDGLIAFPVRGGGQLSVIIQKRNKKKHVAARILSSVSFSFFPFASCFCSSPLSSDSCFFLFVCIFMYMHIYTPRLACVGPRRSRCRQAHGQTDAGPSLRDAVKIPACRCSSSCLFTCALSTLISFILARTRASPHFSLYP